MRQIFRRQRWLRLTLVLLVLTIGGSELADGIACHVATNAPDRTSCGVLVLGYPSNEDGTPSPVQVMRVNAGLKAYRFHRCDRLVFSGAAVKNQVVEAQTMAGLAAGL
jgi:vancomycin permeability regulator SanA